MEAASARAVGGSVGSGGNGMSLSARLFEVQPRRTSALQLHQSELGRQTAEELRGDARVHPQYDDDSRTESEGGAQREGLHQRMAGLGRRDEDARARTSRGLPCLELYNPSPADQCVAARIGKLILNSPLVVGGRFLGTTSIG